MRHITTKFIVRFGTLEIPNCVTLLLVAYKYMTVIWQQGVVVFLTWRHDCMAHWGTGFLLWSLTYSGILIVAILHLQKKNVYPKLWIIQFGISEQFTRSHWTNTTKTSQLVMGCCAQPPPNNLSKIRPQTRLCYTEIVSVVVSTFRLITFYSLDAVACMMQYFCKRFCELKYWLVIDP